MAVDLAPRPRRCLALLLWPLLRLLSLCTPTPSHHKSKRGLTLSTPSTSLHLDSPNPHTPWRKLLRRLGSAVHSPAHKPHTEDPNTQMAAILPAPQPLGPRRALRSLESVAEAEVSRLLQRPLADEMETLVAIAIKAWSRDCLDLLLTYGSSPGKACGPGLFKASESVRVHGGGELGISLMGASSRDKGSLRMMGDNPLRDLEAGEEEGEADMEVAMERLYTRVKHSTMESKLHHTAACALHHPRDLQWVMDPAKGGLLATENVEGLLRELFKRIKGDNRSTKDMKVAAMRAVVEEVGPSPILTLSKAAFYCIYNMYIYTCVIVILNVI